MEEYLGIRINLERDKLFDELGIKIDNSDRGLLKAQRDIEENQKQNEIEFRKISENITDLKNNDENGYLTNFFGNKIFFEKENNKDKIYYLNNLNNKIYLTENEF